MTYVISLKELSSDYFIEGSTLKCGSDTVNTYFPHVSSGATDTTASIGKFILM